MTAPLVLAGRWWFCVACDVRWFDAARQPCWACGGDPATSTDQAMARVGADLRATIDAFIRAVADAYRPAFEALAEAFRRETPQAAEVQRQATPRPTAPPMWAVVPQTSRRRP